MVRATRAVTLDTVSKCIEHVFKDAEQISEETGLGKTCTYSALKALRNAGKVDIEKKGLKATYKLRTEPKEGTLSNHDEKDTKSTDFKKLPQHVAVNGHGIKVIKYSTENLILDKKTVLSKYKHRKLHGVRDFDILNVALREQKNVLFHGCKGSGKSAMVRAFAAEKGLPYFRINLDGMVTAEDLLGQWVRSGQDWAWSDGLLTIAMRYGGILVVDEINAGSPEVNFVFHSVLDDDRQILLRNKDNEVLKAHPNFMLIANMNPNYEGTHPLNEALDDRFDLSIEVGYDTKIEQSIIKDKKLRDFARRIRRMHDEGEISRPISTRTLIHFEDNREKLGEEIAIASMVNKFDLDDRPAIEEAAKQILYSKDDETILDEKPDEEVK